MPVDFRPPASKVIPHADILADLILKAARSGKLSEKELEKAREHGDALRLVPEQLGLLTSQVETFDRHADNAKLIDEKERDFNEAVGAHRAIVQERGAEMAGTDDTLSRRPSATDPQYIRDAYAKAATDNVEMLRKWEAPVREKAHAEVAAKDALGLTKSAAVHALEAKKDIAKVLPELADKLDASDFFEMYQRAKEGRPLPEPEGVIAKVKSAIATRLAPLAST